MTEDENAPWEEIEVPITDELDLHPFRPRDIRNVVRDYLDEAVAAGLREVRLIHGKGIGVQREAVRKVLAAHPAVASFRDGGAGFGEWGATVAVLHVDGPTPAPQTEP